MDSSDGRIERGSGSVFAELGPADADTSPSNREPVSRIDAIVRNGGMTQAKAGRVPGSSQPDASRPLRGELRKCSLESLLRRLTKLGRNFDIVVRWAPLATEPGGLRIAA